MLYEVITPVGYYIPDIARIKIFRQGYLSKLRRVGKYKGFGTLLYNCRVNICPHHIPAGKTCVPCKPVHPDEGLTEIQVAQAFFHQIADYTLAFRLVNTPKQNNSYNFV